MNQRDYDHLRTKTRAITLPDIRALAQLLSPLSCVPTFIEGPDRRALAGAGFVVGRFRETPRRDHQP